ncbi:hypothetical protein PSCLAVI8L_20035 [Pseudoclavibacter sp. 8L]|nr:hypothetical protein PSCLAVI8L_20035 [Pseudoclavibacter sp. 8L]
MRLVSPTEARAKHAERRRRPALPTLPDWFLTRPGNVRTTATVVGTLRTPQVPRRVFGGAPHSTHAMACIDNLNAQRVETAQKS